MEKILVIGAESTIGYPLLQSFKMSEQTVFGTSRHHHKIHDSTLFLDMADVQEFSNYKLPPRFSEFTTIIVCAALTDILYCEQNPLVSYRINVENTLTIARAFQSNKAHVICFSSDKVFNGSRPCMPIDSQPCPSSEYGKQKAALESNILSEGGAIIRLAKVLASGKNIFEGWRQHWIDGKSVEAFADLVMAPIPLFYVVELCHRIVEKKLAGLYQLSASDDISYYKAALIGARTCGVSDCLVKKGRIPDSLLSILQPNAYSSLDSGKAASLLAMPLPSAAEAVRDFFLRICNGDFSKGITRFCLALASAWLWHVPH